MTSTCNSPPQQRHVLALDENDISSARQKLRSRKGSNALEPTETQSSNSENQKFVLTWVSQVLKSVDDQDAQLEIEGLSEVLRTGRPLCRLMNIIAPNTIPNVNTGATTFADLENLNLFVAALKKYCGSNTFYFRPVELANGIPKGFDDLLRSVLQLSVVAAEKGFSVQGYSVEEARTMLSNWKANSRVGNTETQGMNSNSRNQSFEISTSRTRSKSIKQEASMLQSDSGEFNGQIQSKIFSALSNLNSKLEKFEVTEKFQAMKIDRLQEGLFGMFDSMLSRMLEIENAQRIILAELQSLKGQTPTVLGDSDKNSAYGVTEAFNFPQNKSETPAASTVTVVGGPMIKQLGKLPPELEAMNLSDKEKKRQSSIYELLETEEDYVKDLQFIINFYIPKCRQEQLLSDDEIHRLFGNVEDVITASKAFLARLRERQKQTPLIEQLGDILAETIDSFHAYTAYCANYGPAIKFYKQLMTKEDFRNCVNEWKRQPECRGLVLEAFLIKPVQRICKYPLLLREIMKRTGDDHLDYTSLKTAFERMERLVSEVNEEIRVFENKEKVARLQERLDSSNVNLLSQKLILDSNLLKVGQNNTKERYVVLFEDCLLILKNALMNKGRYVIESFVHIHDILMPENNANNGSSKQFTIIVAGDKKETMNLQCSNEEERNRWVASLSEAIAKNFEQRSMSIPEEPFSPEEVSNTWAGRMKKDKISRSATNLRNLSGPGLFEKRSSRASIQKRMSMTDSEMEEARNERDSMVTAPSAETTIPEKIEWNGTTWRRVESALGIGYWFNPSTKETRWVLPDEWLRSALAHQAADAHGGPVVETVEADPHWRKVILSDGTVYFFNELSKETSWCLPEFLAEKTEPDQVVESR